MPDMHGVRYIFTVDGHPEALFQVFEIRGHDELSKPYAFAITLAARDKGLNPSAVVRKKAKLRIIGSTGENVYSGVVFSFDYLRSHHDLLFFRVLLVPRLKLLSLTQHNQVFLNKSLPEILDSVFKERLPAGFELRLQAGYDPIEYVCQYNESSLDFASRLMEHNGLYYFFEESDWGEKLVVTDTLTVHMPIAKPELMYLPASGLDDPERERKVGQLVCERKIVPAKVLLRDYNYQHPNIDLSASADVSEDGEGVYYHYGDHFDTVAEGTRLALIRAQELLAGQEVFTGSGTAHLLRAGNTFNLRRHPLDAYNTTYLLTGVEHSGRDPGFSSTGTDSETSRSEQENSYHNTFKAIFADKQFRPARITEKPRVHGMLHAQVDAEGSGQYAMLDSSGRYKVRMPFDMAGRPAGHASHWVRMAEPYAGANFGMHFPLLKGTEVLLSFIDGDPDRPFISSAVHNAATPGVIKDANSALNAIKSAGNNQLVMGDVKGQEFIGLSSPFHKSSILLGSTKPGGGGSMDFKTEGDHETFVLGCENKAIVGTSNEAIIGAKTGLSIAASTEIFAGMKADCTLGPHFDIKYGTGLEMGSESQSLFTSKAVTGTDKVELCAGISPMLKTTLNQIYALFVVAGLGTAVASASATVMSESFGEEGVISEEASDKGKKASIGVGAGALVASAGLVTVLMGIAYKLMKKVNKSAESSYTSRLDLSQAGASLTVNGYRGQSIANLTALTTPINISAAKQSMPGHTVDYSSYIKMLNDGQNMVLVNKRSGLAASTDGIELAFTDGTKAELKVPQVGVLAFDQTKKKRPIVLLHASNAGLQIDSSGVNLGSPNQANGVVVKNDVCGMTVGNNTQLAMNATTVQVSFTDSFNAGSLKVAADGKITLGGPVTGTSAKFSAEVEADYLIETLPEEDPIVDPNANFQ